MRPPARAVANPTMLGRPIRRSADIRQRPRRRTPRRTSTRWVAPVPALEAIVEILVDLPAVPQRQEDASGVSQKWLYTFLVWPTGCRNARFPGDCGRQRCCSAEVELQTCSSDTPLVTTNQNGRTRPGAGVVDRLHVACVAAGTLAQRAAGQRLIAIPIVSDLGVLLWRWRARRARAPAGTRPVSAAGRDWRGNRSSRCDESRAGARAAACGG